MNHFVHFAVMPILPAATSLITIMITSLVGLVVGIASFRLRDARSLAHVCGQQWRGITVLTLAGAIAWMGFVLSSLKPAATNSVTPDGSSWPVFRGSLTRTGHADQIPGPHQGGIVWTGGRGFQFVSSPAVIDDNIIAVGYQGDTARIFCWKAATGEQLWSVAPNGYRATLSSPVIDQGALFCGEGSHETKNARLIQYALNGDSPPSFLGSIVSSSHIECTPAVSGGLVYFNAGNDGIYCVKIPKVIGEVLEVIWHAPGDRYPDAETALAVFEDRVYVGLGFGGEALCILNAQTGAEIQRIHLPLPCFSTPVISGGRIYLGLGRADYRNHTNGSAGEVRCIDLKTFETMWKVATPAAVLASIVMHDNQIYCSCVDGHLLMIDQSGQIRERWNASVPLLAAPAIANSLVYSVGCDGVMTVLNQNLEPVSSTRLGPPGNYVSSPIVFQGQLYVGTPGDGFVCVGDSQLKSQDQRIPDTPDNFASTLPRSVTEAWTWTGPHANVVSNLTASPAIRNDEIFAPFSQGRTGSLVCATLSDSTAPSVKWSIDLPGFVRVPPRICGDHVVCLCGEPGLDGFCLGVHLESGSITWKIPMELVTSWLVTDGQSAYFQPNHEELVCINSFGQENWRARLGQLNFPIAFHNEIILAATMKPNRLVALDRVTGQQLWSTELTASPTAAPQVFRAEVSLGTTAAMEVFSLVTGKHGESKTKWKQMQSTFKIGGNWIGVAEHGELMLGPVGSSTQQILLGKVHEGIRPLVGLDAVVYAVNEHQLVRTPFSSPDQATPWFKVPDQARLIHHPVAYRDSFLVPIEGIGLVCLKSRRIP